MNEPRTKRGEQTKAKLLAAAEAVFAEQGYQAASISRINSRLSALCSAPSCPCSAALRYQ